MSYFTNSVPRAISRSYCLYIQAGVITKIRSNTFCDVSIVFAFTFTLSIFRCCLNQTICNEMTYCTHYKIQQKTQTIIIQVTWGIDNLHITFKHVIRYVFKWYSDSIKKMKFWLFREIIQNFVCLRCLKKLMKNSNDMVCYLFVRYTLL